MTLNITLDLGHKKELEAFARFCTDLANSSDEIIADVDARQVRLYGPQFAQQAQLASIAEPVVAPQPPIDNDHVAEGAEQFPTLTAVQQSIKDGTFGVQSADAPKRERGQPSPGKARRTKAEIAEDEAAEKPVAHVAIMDADTGIITPAISTGEERVDPQNPEDGAWDGDSPEVVEQDAADEAAETAAAKTDDKLTIEDVRNVIGLYVKAYGLAAAQEDGPKILSSVVPGASKASDIPEDKIADVIAAVKAAGKANTYNRTTVAA